MKLLIFSFSLLCSVAALATNTCPKITGSYVCDKQVLGYATVAIDSQFYDNGSKQEIGMMKTWGNATDHESYLPDEPKRNVIVGSYLVQAGERCEGVSLISEGLVSIGTQQSISKKTFTLNPDGSIKIHSKLDVLIGGVVHPGLGHDQSSICIKQ